MSPRDLWHRLANALRALRSCAQGTAAAEFAVIVPVMGVLLSGTMDLAQLGNRAATIDGALRAGAAYAVNCANNEVYDCTTGITNAITSYSTFAADSVAVTFPNAAAAASDPSYPQYCTFDDGSAATCTAVCSGSQCPMHVYVRIQVVWTLPNPLIPFSIIPTTLTRTLTVRVA